MQEKRKAPTKTAARAPPVDLYEADFYAWTQEQARLLREQRWSKLDVEELAEEVEAVGRNDRRQIESCLIVVLSHLLKWKYQPGSRSPSWKRTLREQRRRIAQIVKETASLGSYPAKVFLEQYEAACLDAADETGMAVELFPDACPFTIEQVLDIDFLPEAPGHVGAKR
jgi:hypothetical protein